MNKAKNSGISEAANKLSESARKFREALPSSYPIAPYRPKKMLKCVCPPRKPMRMMRGSKRVAFSCPVHGPQMRIVGPSGCK